MLFDSVGSHSSLRLTVRFGRLLPEFDALIVGAGSTRLESFAVDIGDSSLADAIDATGTVGGLCSEAAFAPLLGRRGQALLANEARVVRAAFDAGDSCGMGRVDKQDGRR